MPVAAQRRQNVRLCKPLFSARYSKLMSCAYVDVSTLYLNIFNVMWDSESRVIGKAAILSISK